MKQLLFLSTLTLLFTVSLSIPVAHNPTFQSLTCPCDGGSCCDEDEGSSPSKCCLAEKNLMNEEEMMSKFATMFASDPDLTHTVNFIEDDTKVCYHDAKLDEMHARIDRNELNSEVDQGGVVMMKKLEDQ